MIIKETRPKTILSKSKIYPYVINPYTGCQVNCRYCYARYTHEYMGLNDPADFENKIYAKRDAARTLLRELTPERLNGQSIALGTATDPYQPAERRFHVTRDLLELRNIAMVAELIVASAASRFVQRRLDACAVMRCLGSTQGEILRRFAAERGHHLRPFAL